MNKWLEAAPREIIACGELSLRRYRVSDAEELARVVAESFDHLRPHMAWTVCGVPSVEDERALIAGWDAAWTGRSEFAMGIFDGSSLVGSTGFHVRNGPGVLEIGYWVSSSRLREGIATRAASALVDEAFSMKGVSEVVIHHDLLNTSSARVPEKLGFRRVAVHSRTEHPLFSGVDRAEGDGDEIVEWRLSRAHAR